MRKVFQNVDIKKIKAISIFGICFTSTIFFSGQAFCKEDSVVLPGITFEDELDPVEKTSGVLSITYDGENWTDDTDGLQCFDVTSDLKLSYSFDQKSFSTDTDDWHLDGDTLQIQISTCIASEAEEPKWIDSEIKEFSFDEASNGIDNLYTTRDIQLINGCYYQIWVDYDTEKRTKDNKILDDYDYKHFTEMYEFYAENGEEYGESTSDSSVQPRKELGEKHRVKDKSEYSTTQEMKSDDPHYGWDLGTFVVNGYTRESKADDGTPVFLKNLGDKVTLWFHLDQDIEQLNGNDKLSIAEDKKAADRSFEIPKTNFKHGALIIQHTDSQGKKSDPILYTDFLAANAVTGADTKAILFEEGDYEVALDYKIKDSRKKIGPVDAPASYSDYKILFKFGVRNGNCMVYPFDLVTGSELADGAITENGFMLNMANSRYLTIDVTRSVVQETDDGWKTDVRFNQPATDGETYEEPGIYTFDVTNIYTNQHTTKTIYVGNDPVYKALSKNGLTVEKLEEELNNGAEISEDGSIRN